ncbi:glycosyltransferase family 2 protein [Melittangium boletus]|uniref:Family 2 glycosyl transferase n=1 Tax=Melittangium boletus DSM 14713 TaxID=1294270 RepID=A0A250ILM1_9BACT|nr:glycosyltransferase family 2 protein [Melittangium boletus]ATB32130.1 family 2 glycosyl transferase [Melittangium boletus DSM 14713]
MNGPENSGILLSAAVMTKNSLRTLKDCLDSLDFCDEIVVVDDHSTDGTWEYLQSRGGKVRAFQRKLDTFASHRRAMCSRARGQWVLIVDADENALPGLGEEIRELLSQNPRHDAYHVPQKNTLPDHWPRPVHFWTSQKRLLRLGKVRWADSEWIHVPAIHEGKAGRLKHGLRHRSYDSVSHLLRKQISYAQSGARHFHSLGRRASLMKACTHSTGAFIKFYLLKGLFRFGMGGLTVATALSFHAFAKYAFLWELGSGVAESERELVPGDTRA